MRFMIIWRAVAEAAAGVPPGEALIAAMGRYNEQLVRAGVFLQGEGLHSTSKGARVKFPGGKPRVLDGPFAAANELVVGFTMIDVRSKDEAIEWVKRWSTADGAGEVEIEIREVFELADFAANPSTLESPLRASEALEPHERLSEQIAEQKPRRLAPRE